MNGVDFAAGAGLLLLSIIDMKKRAVPVWMTGVLAVFLLVCRFWQGTEVISLVAGLIPGLLVLVLAVGSKGKIGIGDGLVLCALGAGYTLDRVTGILGGALMLAALAAIVLIVFRKAGREKEIPFVPCIFAGYLICAMLY